MPSRIVVTGMGAVTPLGCGVEAYWNNLIEGACGIDRIRSFDADDLAVRIAAEVRDFRVEDHMPKKLIHETDAFTQYAYVAAAVLSRFLGNEPFVKVHLDGTGKIYEYGTGERRFLACWSTVRERVDFPVPFAPITPSFSPRYSLKFIFSASGTS